MTGVDRLGAQLTELAGDKSAMDAPQPATDAVASLQYHDVITGLAPPPRCNQTGKPGTDDHHSHRALTPHSLPGGCVCSRIGVDLSS